MPKDQRTAIASKYFNIGDHTALIRGMIIALDNPAGKLRSAA